MAALDQVERYKAKVQRLEEENLLLLEQFVTWAHNAERKGVTVILLNALLPKPQRDRSKTERWLTGKNFAHQMLKWLLLYTSTLLVTLRCDNNNLNWAVGS